MTPAQLTNQPTKAPSRKVTAAAIGVAVITVLVGVAEQFTGVQLGAEVVGALNTLGAFAAGYLFRERAPVAGTE